MYEKRQRYSHWKTNLVRAHLPRAINTVREHTFIYRHQLIIFDSKERLRGSVADFEMIQKTDDLLRDNGNSLVG